jgi:hypothetical protein
MTVSLYLVRQFLSTRSWQSNLESDNPFVDVVRPGAQKQWRMVVADQYDRTIETKT